MPDGAEDPEIGSVVAVGLGGRAIRGWVVARVEDPPDATILPIGRIISVGPDGDLVALGRFAAERYFGPLRPFLKAASPDRIVRAIAPSSVLPAHRTVPGGVDAGLRASIESAMAAPFGRGGARVVRTGPADSRLGIVAAAASVVGERSLLVLVPEHRDSEILDDRLRRTGARVTRWPAEWPQAAAGPSIVIGTRRAAFARVADLGGIVVLDAHSESYTEERAPTANATVIAAERARRAGVPCLLVSPTPTLELLDRHDSCTLPGAGGWPEIAIIDRTGADLRLGPYDSRLVAALRAALDADGRRRVVCVFNRTGRVRLLSCASCGALQRCEACGAAVGEPKRAPSGAARSLVCPSCGVARPCVCGACGSMKLRQIRVGVGRVAEEISALVGEPATEVTAATGVIPSDVRILVGTEAVLHKVPSASVVAFIDLDQELLATRFRAAEQAWILLGRAARLLGGDSGERHRRIVVQTRLPNEPLLAAARSGDPTRFLDRELVRRRELRLPPAAALARASGDDAHRFAAAVASIGGPVEVAPLADASYLLRAPDHATLLEVLVRARSTGVSCRVSIDPDDV